MGFLDTLLGNTSADAAKAAASDTYNKQQQAIGGIQAAGTTAQNSYAPLAAGYQPYVNTGYTANGAVQNLLADPSSVASLPGYQFDLSQGTRALNAGGAATGNLFSGKTGKALESYGTNLADQTYGSQLARLLGVSQQGQSALGAQNATLGQGIQDKLSTDQSAFQGGMQDAGTIGQGNIAAANAKTQGIQNLLSTGASLAGSIFGSGGGGISSLLKSGNVGSVGSYGQTGNATGLGGGTGGLSFPMFA